VPKQIDYLRYIQYEMNLDLLRKKRKARTKHRKVTLSDFSCTKRIHFIYERALKKVTGCCGV
jgi:U3 small nucleolar RNA-associated protein 6